jgi:hypothetical protein
VQIDPATSSLANVTWTATLSGSKVNAIYANGSYVAKQYTILTAGSVSGTFASTVNTNLPSGFKTALSYDASDVYLNLSLLFIGPPSTGLNINQQNVANSVTGFFNRNGGIPLVFGGLTPAGITQISGEGATAAQQTTFDAMGLFMGVMTDPFTDGRGNAGTSGGAMSYAAEAESDHGDGRHGDRDQGAASAFLRTALERVDRRLRRHTNDHRQCGARQQRRHQPHLRHRGRRRLSLLAGHACRLRARRRGHQFWCRQ